MNKQQIKMREKNFDEALKIIKEAPYRRSENKKSIHKKLIK